MFLLNIIVLVLILPFSAGTLKGKTEYENEQFTLVLKRMEYLESEISLQMDINHNQAVKIEKLERELNEIRLREDKERKNNCPENNSGQKSGTKLHKLKDFNSKIKSRHSRYLLGDMTDRTVGFTAYLSHNVEHLGINQIVVFDKVLFNDGGWYNNGSGIFTCPVDGVYMFFFEVSSGDDAQIVAKLVVNGVNEVDGIADTEQTTNEAQGSNMAILRLTQGSHVSVENYRWGEMKAYSDNTSRFSTFSGILLYQ